MCVSERSPCSSPATLFVVVASLKFLLVVAVAMDNRADAASIVARGRTMVQGWDQHRIRQPCSGSEMVSSNDFTGDREPTEHQLNNRKRVAADDEQPTDSATVVDDDREINREFKQSVAVIGQLLQRLGTDVKQFRNLYVSID
jgi:hypothetical protein